VVGQVEGSSCNSSDEHLSLATSRAVLECLACAASREECQGRPAQGWLACVGRSPMLRPKPAHLDPGSKARPSRAG
jgi:hypothetical protein